MLIREFRIVMPMTVEEYQIAQLYSVAEASKNETGGGEGIEVRANDPFTEKDGVQPKEPLLQGEFNEGQFTHKIYHLASKVPRMIKTIAPKGALEIHEAAWNCYPYCRTVVTNPDYMKENFIIKIESLHLADRGETENAHKLDPALLKKRDVVHIDIANDPVERKAHQLSGENLKRREVVHIDIAHDIVSRADYKPEEDPSKYESKKTGRGPLVGPSWKNKVDPVMTCYKLVTVEFKWWGLQKRVESFILKTERRIFTNFHRQVFCWTDNWHGFNMTDIRALEEKTKDDLDKQRREGEIRGTKAEDE